MFFQTENIYLNESISVSSQFTTMQLCLNEKSNTMVLN